MRDGSIDAAQAALAKIEPVAVSVPSISNDSLAPYFVDYVNRTIESQSESPDASPGEPASLHNHRSRSAETG